MAWAVSCLTSMACRAVLGVLCLLPGALVTAPASAQSAAGAELVMFVEAGCPWCRLWDREVGEAYSRSEEGRKAPLRRIHISEARRSGLMLATAVTVTPTFVLVDRSAEVGRITGYPGADFFWGMVGQLIARLPKVPTGNGSRDAREGEPHDQDKKQLIGPRRLAVFPDAAVPAAATQGLAR